MPNQKECADLARQFRNVAKISDDKERAARLMDAARYYEAEAHRLEREEGELSR